MERSSSIHRGSPADSGQLTGGGEVRGRLDPAERSDLLFSEGDMTFDTWADHWLASCRARLRPSTCSSYEKALRRVRSFIAEYRLYELTPAVLFSVMTQLADRGPRAAQESYTVLRTCLQAAVTIDLLSINPMTKVPKPRWEPQDRDYWSVEQVQCFVDHALESQRKWAPLCVMLATTGLRVSEALGLKWGDVDLVEDRIRVKEPIVFVDHTPVSMSPKTKSAKRWVSLDAVARLALGKMVPGNRDEGVFRTRTGRPPTYSTIRETLLRLCQEANVPPLNPHGLRHVAAMLALRATQDIYVVQRRLGHASPNVTVGIYGYSLDGDHEVATALDTLLGSDSRKHQGPSNSSAQAAD